MSQAIIRIATRKSPLALAQAESVKWQLECMYPELAIELTGIRTEADKQLNQPISTMGGKGLFVKALEKALIERRADIAVHSLKDMTAILPPPLVVAAISKRHLAHDVLLSPAAYTIENLPKGAKVGTGSLRRTAQLKAHRPDLNILPIRGNVGTRLKQLEQGQFDALVLAAAGLARLSLDVPCTPLDPSAFIPAAGQGMLATQCRKSDTKILALIRSCLDHPPSRQCALAERAVNLTLGGSCITPVAAYATIQDNNMHVHAMVGSLDGKQTLISHQQGKPEDAADLGSAAGRALLAQGAADILANTAMTF